MNLIMDKNTNGGMTLDNRTFIECSKRMQHFTPTISRKDLIITPLGQFEMVGNNEVCMKCMKLNK